MHLMPQALMEMDNHLMGLIEALEGRLGQLREGGARAGGAGGAADGVGVGPAEPSEPEADIVPPEPEAEHISQVGHIHGLFAPRIQSWL